MVNLSITVHALPMRALIFFSVDNFKLNDALFDKETNTPKHFFYTN